MTNEALAGKGLLQSRKEWDTRNQVLADTLSRLVNRYAPRSTGAALDVGCQSGLLTDALNRRTDYAWAGIEPTLAEEATSPNGARLIPGKADEIRFPDGEFDVVLFANVFEHVLPEERDRSLREMFRVLTAGGAVVGQIPNPYFPIESHSRLPFMGWLPMIWQRAYWRLSPVPWEHDFFVVTMNHLRKTAVRAGFEVVHAENFNYPAEVLPASVRWAARVLSRPMRRFPWAWQFVLRRP